MRFGGFGSRRGQAMLEYLIATVVVLSMAGVLTLLLYAVRQNGDRVLNLVASEYP